MSSVLIRGMEMPENCAECKMWSICECLNDFEDFESICYAVEDGDLVRDKNCPLIELPPHGRLADLDKIIEDYWDGTNMEIDEGDLKAIIQYKVVIEAEGETE